MIQGNLCEKHPDLNGLRRNSGRCVGCHREALRRAYANRVATEEGRETHREAVKMACRKRRENDEVREVERQKIAAKRMDPEYKKLECQRTLAWREKNPGRAIFSARVRRDKVAQQMPAWADRKAINEIYRKAKELGLTVDHVIPLRNPLVSGLHVESNLDLVSRSANSSKSNSFSIL